MNWKIIGASIAILSGFSLAFMAQNHKILNVKIEQLNPEIQTILQNRIVYIDAAELLDTIHNNDIRLRLFDVRDEVSYNLFHILDAQRVTFDLLKSSLWIKNNIPNQTVIVLMSNDESLATQAWKLLFVQSIDHIYILEGGINNWLSLYHTNDISLDKRINHIDESLNYLFRAALGGNHPASNPDIHDQTPRKYLKKIKPIGNSSKKSGGCG